MSFYKHYCQYIHNGMPSIKKVFFQLSRNSQAPGYELRVYPHTPETLWWNKTDRLLSPSHKQFQECAFCVINKIFKGTQLHNDCVHIHRKSSRIRFAHQICKLAKNFKIYYSDRPLLETLGNCDKFVWRLSQGLDNWIAFPSRHSVPRDWDNTYS